MRSSLILKEVRGGGCNLPNHRLGRERGQKRDKNKKVSYRITESEKNQLIYYEPVIEAFASKCTKSKDINYISIQNVDWGNWAPGFLYLPIMNITLMRGLL